MSIIIDDPRLIPIREKVEAGERLSVADGVTLYGTDDILLAPGILQNPVPVRALYNRDVACDEALRNLLQRRGFTSLEAVQAESEARGEAQAVLKLLEIRGLRVTEAQRQTILDCRDIEQIGIWLQRAISADSADSLFQCIDGKMTLINLST